MTIKDLSTSAELDREAMTAVHGGDGNQAVGTSQGNLQNMAAMANVGNASLYLGPATIQSDNTFTQTAYNDNHAANFDVAIVGLRWPTFIR